MIDVIVKLLIAFFTLAVGGCFALWPEEVGDRLDRWRGRSVGPAERRGLKMGKRAEALWLRQIGIMLIAGTCYAI